MVREEDFFTSWQGRREPSLFLPHSFPSQRARKQLFFQQTASNEDISDIHQPKDRMKDQVYEPPCKTSEGP